MNRQEIFDKAYLAILKQGRPSTGVRNNSFQSCLYRGEQGVKCVIGHLIPDDLYQPEIEGRMLYVLLQLPEMDDAGYTAFRAIFNKIFPDASREDIEFLHSLQLAHDQAALSLLPVENFLERFKARAKQFALAYGLSIPSEPCQ